MKVYIIVYRDYEDFSVVNVFTDKILAMNYLERKNSKNKKVIYYHLIEKEVIE